MQDGKESGSPITDSRNALGAESPPARGGCGGGERTRTSLRTHIDRWAQRRAVLVMALMVTYSSQSLLITASKRQGTFLYDIQVIVFLAEVLKLIFAVVMLPEPLWRIFLRGALHSWVFAIPAMLYMVQNGLVFYALLALSPPEYQLLNNLKLFTTALTFRLVVKKQLKVIQWLALMLLGLGMTLSSYEPPATMAVVARDDDPAQEQSHNRWWGVCLMVLISMCSSSAGAANERLLKGSRDVYEANLWLYAYGCLIQAARLNTAAWSQLVHLEGFSISTWLIVLCNALLGQTIAYLFKYADSIVKIYTTSMTIVFTTLVSIVLFDFELKFRMVVGFLTSVISLVLYYLPADILLATDSQIIATCKARADGGHPKSS